MLSWTQFWFCLLPLPMVKILISFVACLLIPMTNDTTIQTGHIIWEIYQDASSSLARGGIFSNFSWCLSLHTESRRSFNLFFSDAFILIIIGLFYCYWWCSRISLGDEEPDQILFIASKKFFFKTAAPLLTLWKSSFGQSPIR